MCCMKNSWPYFCLKDILEVFNYHVHDNSADRIRNSMFPNHWITNNKQVNILLILKTLLHPFHALQETINLNPRPFCAVARIKNRRVIEEINAPAR